MSNILNELFENSDPAYKEFHKKLIPTIDEGTILGVRSPCAQAIAKKYTGTSQGEKFLLALPHSYYDENIVHAFMLGNLRLSREEIWERVVAFLPYVDNWAVCDGLASHLKYLFRDKDILFPLVISLLEGEGTYTIRFGLVCLLNYYITDEYIDTLLEICVKTKSDEYYINMALAWLISFMLIKEYDKSVSLLESGVLDKWVHNKSIQKARESYRISENQKSYLKTLRR